MVVFISKLFRSTCYYLVTFNQLIITLKLLKVTEVGNDGDNTHGKCKEKEILNDCTDTLKFWTVFAVFQTLSFFLEKYTSRIPGYNYFFPFLIGLLLFPKLRIANAIYDDIIFKFYLACKHRLKAQKIHSTSDFIHTLLLLGLVIIFPNIIHKDDENVEKISSQLSRNDERSSTVLPVPAKSNAFDDDTEFFMPHFENESSNKLRNHLNDNSSDNDSTDDSVDGFDIIKELSYKYPLTASSNQNNSNVPNIINTPVRMKPLNLSNTTATTDKVSARHKHVDDDIHDNNVDEESYQLLSHRSPSAKSQQYFSQSLLHSPQSIQSRSRKSSVISNNSDHTANEVNVTIRTPPPSSIASAQKRSMSVVKGISQSKSRLSQLTPFFHRLKESSSSSAVKESISTSSANKNNPTTVFRSPAGDVDYSINKASGTPPQSLISASSSQRHSFFPKSTSLSFYINKSSPTVRVSPITSTAINTSSSSSIHNNKVTATTACSSSSQSLPRSRPSSRSRNIPSTFPSIGSTVAIASDNISSPTRSNNRGQIHTNSSSNTNSDTLDKESPISRSSAEAYRSGSSFTLQQAREASSSIVSSNNRINNTIAIANNKDTESDSLLLVPLSLPLAHEMSNNNYSNSNNYMIDADTAVDGDGTKVTVRNRSRRLVKSVFTTASTTASNNSASNITSGVRTRSTSVSNSRNVTENKNKQ